MAHFQRGFYRLNVHEMWRCPHQNCARFVCALDPDAEQHSYLLMDERMCISMMRQAHVIDSTLWKRDFERFFSFQSNEQLVRLPTCTDVVATSAQTPKMMRRLTSRALNGGKLAQAQLKWQQTIDSGRDYGIREDWQRYARWLGGGNAWRLLHRQLEQLEAQIDRRRGIFDTTCELLKSMAWNEADGPRPVNTDRVERLEQRLQRATKLVKKVCAASKSSALDTAASYMSWTRSGPHVS
eukprot:915018-Rhodomonas_salina.1